MSPNRSMLDHCYALMYRGKTGETHSVALGAFEAVLVQVRLSAAFRSCVPSGSCCCQAALPIRRSLQDHAHSDLLCQHIPMLCIECVKLEYLKAGQSKAT